MHGTTTASALLVLAALASPAWAQSPIVAVFGIEGTDAKVPPKTLEKLTEYLAASLGGAGRFQVIPSSQLKKRLNEAKAESYQACYEQSCQIEIGKELAAQKSLSTKILRIGNRCVLTSSLFDLRTAVTERSATQESDCKEESLLAAVRGVAMELGSAPKEAPKEVAAPAPRLGLDPNLLSAWKQQESGDFEERDGGLIGSTGRMAYLEPVKDFALEFDAELLGGAPSSSVGICWRGGGAEGQIPTRGYCFGFQWLGAYNLFVGISGSWTPITKGWAKGQPYKPEPRIQPKRNHVRLVARGATYQIFLNGELLESGTDPTHGSGKLFLGAEPGGMVKLSKISVQAL